MERKAANRANGVKESGDKNVVNLNGARMSELSKAVQAVQQEASWWDLYGVDWCIIASGLALFPLGVWLLSFPDWVPFLAGFLSVGLHYSMIKTKTSHLAAHSALCSSRAASRLWELFFIEFCGSFSSEFAHTTHIKVHHPHTNIVGLGDSSTWKVPFLPRLAYLFGAPLLMPLLTPVMAVVFLIQGGKYGHALRCGINVYAGLAAYISVLVYASGLTLGVAVVILFASRAVLEIPYIHVNIFQHIGLPMYAQDNRPPRLYMMASGVLNLSHNPLLDWAFGHSLIACHVEHHLFPSLSDNMCLKIRPLVKKYLEDHQLPYCERGYLDRLRFFLKEYEELMVRAPPITEFIGIQ